MRISLNALHFSESDFPKEFINQPHQYQINKAPYTKTENTFSAAFFWEGGICIQYSNSIHTFILCQTSKVQISKGSVN
jgi:hypothetical protein